MIPHFNLWIEAEGGVVVSPWRARLLAAIATSGSISAAADQMKIPYRRAWEKLKEMEANYGRALLDTEVGGAHGGGTRLTPAAHDLLERFGKFEGGLEEEIQARYREAFDG